jgi:hypothetical protein
MTWCLINHMAKFTSEPTENMMLESDSSHLQLNYFYASDHDFIATAHVLLRS